MENKLRNCTIHLIKVPEEKNAGNEGETIRCGNWKFTKIKAWYKFLVYKYGIPKKRKKIKSTLRCFKVKLQTIKINEKTLIVWDKDKSPKNKWLLEVSYWQQYKTKGNGIISSKCKKLYLVSPNFIPRQTVIQDAAKYRHTQIILETLLPTNPH